MHICIAEVEKNKDNILRSSCFKIEDYCINVILINSHSMQIPVKMHRKYHKKKSKQIYGNTDHSRLKSRRMHA